MDKTCEQCGSCNLVEELEGEVLLVCSDCGHVTAATANLDHNYGSVIDGEYHAGVHVDSRGFVAAAQATATGVSGTFRQVAHTHAWKDEARRLADSLSFNKQVLELLLVLVDMLQHHGYQQSYDWRTMLAACAYIIIRQQELPYTLRDVAIAANLTASRIARCFNRIKAEQEMQLPPSNIRGLVTRHINTLFSTTAMPSARPAPPNPTHQAVLATSLRLLDLLKACDSSTVSPLTTIHTVVRLSLEAHIRQRKRTHWMLANLQAALSMPLKAAENHYFPHVRNVLLALSPLMPYLPPNNVSAVVRHCDDALQLCSTLARMKLPHNPGVRQLALQIQTIRAAELVRAQQLLPEPASHTAAPSGSSSPPRLPAASHEQPHAREPAPASILASQHPTHQAPSRLVGPQRSPPALPAPVSWRPPRRSRPAAADHSVVQPPAGQQGRPPRDQPSSTRQGSSAPRVLSASEVNCAAATQLPNSTRPTTRRARSAAKYSQCGGGAERHGSGGAEWRGVVAAAGAEEGLSWQLLGRCVVKKPRQRRRPVQGGCMCHPHLVEADQC